MFSSSFLTLYHQQIDDHILIIMLVNQIKSYIHRCIISNNPIITCGYTESWYFISDWWSARASLGELNKNKFICKHLKIQRRLLPWVQSAGFLKGCTEPQQPPLRRQPACHLRGKTQVNVIHEGDSHVSLLHRSFMPTDVVLKLLLSTLCPPNVLKCK